MEPISYLDLTTGEGRESYAEKARSNLALFDQILGARADVVGLLAAFEDDGPNRELLRRISELSGIGATALRGVNVADEVMNLNGMNLFGCTSVARGRVIGQTLDLFTLDLAIVREPDAVYVTMPPYLTLMGLGRHVAFCTNFIPGPVRANGVPVSRMRRELLRRHDVEDAVEYLLSIERASPVNFLVADDHGRVVDLEVGPGSFRRIESLEPDGILAHTNHLVSPTFDEDRSCSRLARAMDRLRDGLSVRETLADPAILLPVVPVTEDYGFGSTVTVEMNVRSGTISWRDPWMVEYASAQL